MFVFVFFSSVCSFSTHLCFSKHCFQFDIHRLKLELIHFNWVLKLKRFKPANTNQSHWRYHCVGECEKLVLVKQKRKRESAFFFVKCCELLLG